jgi:hypothetical protein
VVYTVEPLWRRSPPTSQSFYTLLWGHSDTEYSNETEAFANNIAKIAYLFIIQAPSIGGAATMERSE